MAILRMRQVYRNLKTGKMGTDYVSLLPKKLTLRRGFLARRLKGSNDLSSLFREVETAPLGDVVTPELRQVFRAKPTVEWTKKGLVEKMKANLKAVVEREWSPDLFHVVMHSSGYDSRNLSWTIKTLAEEHGEEWLGPGVMFLCSRWEGAEFARIMQYEGWDPSEYRVAAPERPDGEYYARSLLDFEGAWERLGGTSVIPVNLYWWPVRWAQERGLIPDRVQMFTGCWGNTVTELDVGGKGNRGFKFVYKFFYYSLLFQRPYKGVEYVHPYADHELAMTVATSKLQPGGWLRTALLRSMDEGLSKFRNTSSDGDKGRTIAPWIMKRVVKDYVGSWYGRAVHPKARPTRNWTECQPFWSHWSAASLCEHLLASGHEIRIG